MKIRINGTSRSQLRQELTNLFRTFEAVERLNAMHGGMIGTGKLDLNKLADRSKKRVPVKKFSPAAREHTTAFGAAAKAGKNLRDAIGPLKEMVIDGTCSNRLMKKLMQMINANTASVKSKGLENADMDWLDGFRFNGMSSVESILTPFPVCTLDRANGHMIVDIPSFYVPHDLSMPEKATHYQFVSAGIEIDFARSTSSSDVQKTDILPVTDNCGGPQKFVFKIEGGGSNTLFLVLGIRFLKQGMMVYNQKYCPLQIIKVWKPEKNQQ